jgi:hypothetical protein
MIPLENPDSRLRIPSTPYRRMRLVAPTLAAVALATTACLPIPHRFVYQPGLVALVTDTAKRPAHDVTLVVYSASSRNGGMRVRTSIPPQIPPLGLGPVGAPPAMTFLPRQTHWHLAWWLLPGMNRRYFAWCVSAPGFARQGARMAGTHTDTVRLALVPSATPDLCPERVFNLDEVIAPAPRDSTRH